MFTNVSHFIGMLLVCFPQTCLLLVVNVIGQRMDFYAMLHAFALIAVMYKRRRKAIAEIWPKYCCFLACMLTFQYFVCIGIPPAACKGLCDRLIKLNFLPMNYSFSRTMIDILF